VASSCNADGVEFGLSLEDFADGMDAESFNSFYADQVEDTEEQKKVRRRAENRGPSWYGAGVCGDES